MKFSLKFKGKYLAVPLLAPFTAVKKAFYANTTDKSVSNKTWTQRKPVCSRKKLKSPEDVKFRGSEC
jgi:hypothetical protein